MIVSQISRTRNSLSLQRRFYAKSTSRCKVHLSTRGILSLNELVRPSKTSVVQTNHRSTYPNQQKLLRIEFWNLSGPAKDWMLMMKNSSLHSSICDKSIWVSSSHIGTIYTKMKMEGMLSTALSIQETTLPNFQKTTQKVARCTFLVVRGINFKLKRIASWAGRTISKDRVRCLWTSIWRQILRFNTATNDLEYNRKRSLVTL